MNIIRTSHSKRSNFYWLVCALTKLVDSLVILCSLGFLWSDLEFKFKTFHILKVHKNDNK
jgi:predicted RNA-binding protein associated with RNAse of E/G family